jgi:hypothetical protein
METNLREAHIVQQTKNWIIDVVIGCNFCPFAAKEIKRNAIHYEVLESPSIEYILQAVSNQFNLLNNNPNIETSLLILPKGFSNFSVYLALVEKAEMLLHVENYDGIYQIASFHPQYLFAGTTNQDASNYTNRSPYPMLHFLREASVTKAVTAHLDIDKVPLENIAFTQAKGLNYMQQLFASCMDLN